MNYISRINWNLVHTMEAKIQNLVVVSINDDLASRFKLFPLKASKMEKFGALLSFPLRVMLIEDKKNHSQLGCTIER